MLAKTLIKKSFVTRENVTVEHKGEVNMSCGCRKKNVYTDWIIDYYFV